MIPRLNVVLMAASIVACSILSWRLSRASEEERIRVSALELIGQKTLHEITELRAKNSHSMVSPQVKSSPVQNEAPSAKSASKRDWDPWGFEKTLSHRPDLQNSKPGASRAFFVARFPVRRCRNRRGTDVLWMSGAKHNDERPTHTKHSQHLPETAPG